VFNFGSPDVRAFLIENAKFLLSEYRIDGLRYDQTSVIDHDGAPNGWSFLQDLSSTVRYARPGALQKAEYWNVNPYVVRPIAEGGAGFDTTLTDGLRIAIRNAITSASVPGQHPLPMTQIAESLWPAGFQTSWRFVQGPENHDLVYRDREQRMPRLSDPSDSRSWYARSRSRVATGLCLTAPGIPMLFMGQEFMEDKQWADNLELHPELRLFWPGLEGPDPAMRDFLRFTRELIRLRWAQPALRGEGFRVVHVHDENRILAMHRWVVGQGYDIIVTASLADETRSGYRIGFPGEGRWAELFNSDVYDGWVNPNTSGNGGSVNAERIPMHGFAYSAALVVPANAILVFGRG
jgi:1,4-alpha-glucan branching enzyme